MHRGFAKVYRKFLEWEWYDDHPCKILYIHCLLKANHKDKDYRGATIKRGTFVSSYQKLADQTGLSVKQVRLAMDKLEPKYLTSNKTKKGQTISIINFELYNSFADEEGKQEGTIKADRGQDKGKIRATTKKDKHLKNEKNEKNEKKKKHRPKDFLKEKNVTWINQMIWEEWIDFKTKKKASLSSRALNANVNKLKEFGTDYADLIISQSLNAGWTDFYELKGEKKTFQTQQEKNNAYFAKMEKKFQREEEHGKDSNQNNAIILNRT